jgi:hypothetical protein
MFNFQAVLVEPSRFYHAAKRNGATNPDSNAENGQLLCNSQ